MRPTRLLLVGVCCWLVPAAAFPQDRPTGVIHGFVVDSITRSAIAGALLMLEGRDEVRSDGRGRFVLSDVPIGEYLLAAITRDCRIAAVRLRLHRPDSVRLDLEVGLQRLEGGDAARTRERAEGTALKVTTRAEIQALGERSLPDILRRIAPSMVGAPASRPGASVRLSERGVSTVTGSRTPLLLIDGVRVTDTRVLESLDPGIVTRIEVGAGAVGGWEHGIQGASGVIHIHTQRGRWAADSYCGRASH